MTKPPSSSAAATNSLDDQYADIFELIRKHFPYGNPAEITVPTDATLVKDGWLKNNSVSNPRFVREQEAKVEGDPTSLHWEFNGEVDSNGKPLRVTKAIKFVYKYQRPKPVLGADGKPKMIGDKWEEQTDPVTGETIFETKEASVLIGYRGPSH